MPGTGGPPQGVIAPFSTGLMVSSTGYDGSVTTGEDLESKVVWANLFGGVGSATVSCVRSAGYYDMEVVVDYTLPTGVVVSEGYGPFAFKRLQIGCDISTRLP